MPDKIARLTKIRTVREGPKSLNQNALKYCEIGPCKIMISRYKSFPSASCQGMYNCWPKSTRRSGHFRQLHKAITRKTKTIRQGPAHFSNHLNFSRAVSCCAAFLLDGGAFDFLRLMPTSGIRDCTHPSIERTRSIGTEREISIEFRVSPEHDRLSKLGAVLERRPESVTLGRVSVFHGIETSSSPKLRRICVQRKNGRLRPRAL